MDTVSASRTDRTYARWLQTSLNHAMGLRLPLDGNIGPKTRSALRDFQRRSGLKVDGTVGPLTEAALIRAGAAAPRASVKAIAAVPVVTDFLKDRAALRAASLAPAAAVPIVASWPKLRRRVARIYNRLGGLMQRLGEETQVMLPAVLSVWSVECGNLEHTRGRAVIRFENHLLYRLWGTASGGTYSQYFQHGGHSGVSGKAWEHHAFRETPAAPFIALHGDQEREYRALQLAAQLAGPDIAYRCISIGGPQILVSNHRLLGYGGPADMVSAFQDDERWHVLGFFDFCQRQPAPTPGGLMQALRARQWDVFARYYNGPGQVPVYSALLADSFTEAAALRAS
jgi:hypothetical protein